MISRKDYELIAAQLRRNHPIPVALGSYKQRDERLKVGQMFADVFEQVYPSFKRYEFIEAVMKD